MESLEDAQARHRRELRDLQGRITNKKKNATKKTRKGVLDECAGMERALREKQEAELRALRGEKDEDDDNDDKETETDPLAEVDVPSVTTQLADTTLDAQEITPSESAPKKKNRQRERLARRAAAAQRDADEAAAEAAHMVDHAALERTALAPLIAQSGRVEHLIRPDGHCLFSAVADQMAEVNRPLPLGNEYRQVRHDAAAYMEAHPDDFAPFLIGDDDNGHDTSLPAHIARIRNTAEWGGQLELRALACAYDVDIRVLHDGRSELVRPAGADDDDKTDKNSKRPTLWLVYYRHGFGLGEHYNSLRTKKTTTDTQT